MTLAGVQKRNESMMRGVVPFDGGNRTLQYLGPDGVVYTLPSFYKQIDLSWEDAEPAPNSVLIQSGEEVWCVGQSAKDANGTPVFEAGKVSLTPKLVLAALIPNKGQSSLYVDRLLLALPNSRSVEAREIFKSIEGTHEFIRDGQHIVATVSKVELVDETRAAYQYARQMGIFQNLARVNGIIDLGGGTAIGRLYSESGTLLREADVILPGTNDLANKIAVRIQNQMDYTPELYPLMDGIERGDYCIGEGGFCFKRAFDSAYAEWIDDIWKKVTAKWRPWNAANKLGEVLIIGGSAPLGQPFVEKTKGRFKISDQPQTISILGMQSL